MKAVQKEAVARQVQLDEESLQRLKKAEAKDKVHCETVSGFCLEKEEEKAYAFGFQMGLCDFPSFMMLLIETKPHDVLPPLCFDRAGNKPGVVRCPPPLDRHATLIQSIIALAQDKKQQGKLGTGDAPTDVTEVTATFTANVWEVKVTPGDEVLEGQTLVILEAMKMEYPVTAPHAGKVSEVMAKASELAQQGDVLLTIGKAEATTSRDTQEKHPEE